MTIINLGTPQWYLCRGNDMRSYRVYASTGASEAQIKAIGERRYGVKIVEIVRAVKALSRDLKEN